MSLKKIAEETGVSVSTVSRVLSGKDPKCASVSVQDKIRDAARRLHYVPNPYAKALKKGEGDIKPPCHVAVVLFRVHSLEDDPFFRELFRCVERELLARGCVVRLVMQPTEESIRTLAREDGIVLLGRCTGENLRTVRAVNRCVVGIWRNPAEGELDQVYCSGRKAAGAAVSYLVGLGHREIAYVGDCSEEGRFVGYTQALLEHGIPIRLPLVYETDQTGRAGAAAMEKILRDGAATAVLCANDCTALGALETLKKADGKRHIQVSVISIDNIDASAWTKPMLTTMNIPRQDMAHLGISLLLDRIQKGHSEYIRMELPSRLMERETCFVEA